MEFNKTIAARQSVRKFTEAQITDEQLKAILEAANAAPACMGQYDHLHLTVVQKPEILAQINAAFRQREWPAMNQPIQRHLTIVFWMNNHGMFSQ